MRPLALASLALLLALGGRPAAAACGLGCSCTIAATDIAFGSYDPFSGSAAQSTGTVTVTCTTALSLTVSYTIALSTGGSGSYAARRLANGGQQLLYNLYREAGHSSIWGNGSGGSATVTDSYLMLIGSNVRHYTAYGRVPAGQMAAPGSYLDTITATVTW
jgi:spore coat protein U-like protein